MPGFDDGGTAGCFAQFHGTAVEQHQGDGFAREQQFADACPVDIVVFKQQNQVGPCGVGCHGTGQGLAQGGCHVGHQRVVARHGHLLHPCRIHGEHASGVAQQGDGFVGHLQGRLAELGIVGQGLATGCRGVNLRLRGQSCGMGFVEHALPGAHVGRVFLFPVDAYVGFELTVGLESLHHLHAGFGGEVGALSVGVQQVGRRAVGSCHGEVGQRHFGDAFACQLPAYHLAGFLGQTAVPRVGHGELGGECVAEGGGLLCPERGAAQGHGQGAQGGCEVSHSRILVSK